MHHLAKSRDHECLVNKKLDKVQRKINPKCLKKREDIDNKITELLTEIKNNFLHKGINTP